jgi:hypothetical protein
VQGTKSGVTEREMASKKTSIYTKLIYGSDSDRALIESTRQSMRRLDQHMYEEGLKNKEHNKFVEKHNKYIDENPHLGWKKWEKLPEASLMKGIILPRVYDTLLMTLRHIMLLVFYGLGFWFLIWLIQKF